MGENGGGTSVSHAVYPLRNSTGLDVAVIISTVIAAAASPFERS